MSNFTEEQLEEIEDAWRKSGRDWAAMRDQLQKPKHEFAEGEVICSGGEGNWSYVRFESDEMDLSGEERPLTLSEMPKAVEDLREAVKRIPNETVINGTHGIEMLRDMAEEALAAFDSEISHE